MDYRKATNISDDLGTAVNIVTMVFGNMGDDSGTGVAFTRNPSTGDKKMMGEYLLNAQGEDVVAGIRNADPIEQLGNEDARSLQTVHGYHCQAGEALQGYAGCRVHHRARQTVDAADPQCQAHRQGCHQDRHGYGERRLDLEGRCVLRVSFADVDTLLHPQFDDAALKTAEKAGAYYVKGVNASPGAAVGQVYFDADKAEKMAKERKAKSHHGAPVHQAG